MPLLSFREAQILYSQYFFLCHFSSQRSSTFFTLHTAPFVWLAVLFVCAECCCCCCHHYSWLYGCEMIAVVGAEMHPCQAWLWVVSLLREEEIEVRNGWAPMPRLLTQQQAAAAPVTAMNAGYHPRRQRQ